MEIPLRAALLAWLASDTTLSASLNEVVEEAPSRVALPWLAITGSASTDWSTKTNTGLETTITLEMRMRGDVAGSGSALVSALQSRVASLPRAQSGFTIASIGLLRSQAKQVPENNRSVVLEYRFRVMAA